MIIDYLQELARALSIIANQNATVVSTYSYDTGSRDIGGGNPVKGRVQIETTVVGGSGGVKIDYIESAAADLTNAVVLASKTTAATPDAGAVVFDMVLPPNALRYVGFQFTALGSAVTTGKVDAWILADTPNWTAKPDGL